MGNELGPRNSGPGGPFALAGDTKRRLEIAGKVLALKRAIKSHSARSGRSVEMLKRDLEKLERRLRFLDSA